MKTLKFPSGKIVLFALLLLLGTGSLWYKNQAAQKEQTKKTEKTYLAERKNFQETITISGKVDASEKTTLRFQSSGRLTWVGVKEGDTVKKYQTIATLDQRDVQAALDKALRDYSKERNDFEETWRVTYNGLSNPNAALTDSVKRILQKNQWDLEKSVLDVELKHLAVEYASLFSPIDGIVTRAESPYAGVNITPSQAEFDIINPETVYLSVLPDQTEITKLTASASAEIVFDAYPQEKVSGTIKTLAFTPKDGESGTVYEVKVAFPTDGSAKYRIGMTADATFLLNVRHNILMIPTAAMKKENGKPYVFEKNNRGERIKIQIIPGDELNEFTEILSGLEAGEKIFY